MELMIPKQPLISIVTPVYNGAEYLEDLILSVLAQDYQEIEHILIDDGSNDNGETVTILRKYPHLRWWSRENKGQYTTVNEGLLAARGDVISIICADDKYVTPSAFSAVIEFWQHHPDCGCVYGDTLRMNEYGELLALDPTLPKPPFSAWLIGYWMLIPHCSLFVNKKLLIEHKLLFDESLNYVADWDWLFRLTHATKFAYLNQSLSVYREHTNQASQTARKKIVLEEQQLRQRNRANPLIHFLLINQHRILKLFWVLRKNGAFSLYCMAKQWLNR